MKYQVYFGIAIRIVILFGVGMLWTFINPTLRDFLGDIHLAQPERAFFGIDADWQWGARHYWYFWMMFLLFILSLITVIMGIGKTVNRHYPNTF